MLREPGFQGFDARLELTQCIAHAVQIGSHGRRGLFPVLGGKGNGQTVVVGSDRGAMTSPGGRQQRQTNGHGLPERGDQSHRQMREARDTKRHDLRLTRIATL
jgi:hypothetical protein